MTKSVQEIILGCRKGKANAQRELVNRFSGLLYTVSLRYMRDTASAQDVLQDSFIKIFRAMEQFDPQKGSLEGWMRRIVINTALKQLDKRKLNTSSLTVEDYNISSKEPTPVDNMNRDDLVKIIQTLPEGYRQVFNLSVIEGYSHKEIADMLGIGESSSRSNLSRAKYILRKKLYSYQNNEPWVKTS